MLEPQRRNVGIGLAALYVIVNLVCITAVVRAGGRVAAGVHHINLKRRCSGSLAIRINRNSAAADTAEGCDVVVDEIIAADRFVIIVLVRFAWGSGAFVIVVAERDGEFCVCVQQGGEKAVDRTSKVGIGTDCFNDIVAGEHDKVGAVALYCLRQNLNNTRFDALVVLYIRHLHHGELSVLVKLQRARERRERDDVR